MTFYFGCKSNSFIFFIMVQHKPNPNSVCEAEDKWMVSWGTVGRAGTDTREVLGTLPSPVSW